MAINNYSTLQSTIADWLHRNDLTSQIKDFIAIAEQRMNADLTSRAMETTTTLTMVAGTAALATPTDVIETRRIRITSTDPERVLNYMAPERLASAYPYSTTGRPEVYSVIGGNFEFAPTPDTDYTVEYIYRQMIPALSDSNTSNWLLAKWPYIYLYGALCAAAPYIQDDQRVKMLEQQYQMLVLDINSIDWYTGSNMAVRAV